MSKNNGWISVTVRKPELTKEQAKPDAFGVQVLIWPPFQDVIGYSDSLTAFYGTRVTDKPNFYLYGRVIDVTHWQPRPEGPTINTENSRRIVCAALNRDGEIICGVRHFDVIMCELIAVSKTNWRQATQGFVDNFGNFLTREEAWPIAEQAQQIIYDRVGKRGKLHSEDIY